MNTSAVEPVLDVIWDARLTQFLAQSDDYGTDLLRHAARYSFSNMVAKIRIAAAAGNAGSLFPMMLVPFNNAGDFNELSYESLSTAPDRTDIAARTAAAPYRGPWPPVCRTPGQRRVPALG
ncbi:MAG: hypothetical protein U5P41_07345 [Gammaproteobacteria bacterium]|nr:hypothetical protein [Gammaproteobacteria bacterium]